MRVVHEFDVSELTGMALLLARIIVNYVYGYHKWSASPIYHL